VELSHLFTAISLVGTLPAAVTGGFLVVLLVVGLLVVGLLVVGLLVVGRLVVVFLDGFRVEVVLLVVGLLVVVEVVEGASSSKALPEAHRPGYVAEQEVPWGQAEQLAPLLYISPLMKLPFGA